MSAATTLTLTEHQPIQCMTCRAVYRAPTARTHPLPEESSARADGWTVWTGTTMTGKPDRRVYCRSCAGRITDPETGEVAEPKWDARCRTCDWEANEEDEYEANPFSEKDAKRWVSDHECEPDAYLVRPGERAS